MNKKNMNKTQYFPNLFADKIRRIKKDTKKKIIEDIGGMIENAAERGLKYISYYIGNDLEQDNHKFLLSFFKERGFNVGFYKSNMFDYWYLGVSW